MLSIHFADPLTDPGLDNAPVQLPLTPLIRQRSSGFDFLYPDAPLRADLIGSVTAHETQNKVLVSMTSSSVSR